MSQTEVQLIKADAVVTADIANSAVTDAKISGLTSSKLTGALPAISGAALTGIASAGKAKNLIINGAMQVAQRGTSNTTNGYGTVDRFANFYNGTDEAPTQAQVAVAAGTTPYTSGFRNALKITNGNQTSGVGSTDYIWIQHKLEAQDISNSGWNYTSASSNITLSFWVKSSLAQDFKGYLRTKDGTSQMYPFATGSLSADTWTKITKTIPGNSNLQFDNDVNEGLEINIAPFFGTDLTNNATTEDAWAAYVAADRTKDNTSTWWTTNDATFEITGVQLEVGDNATDFELLSYQETLLRCYRYFYAHIGMLWGITSAGDHLDLNLTFPIPMRTAPSRTQNDTSLLFKNRLDQNNSTSATTYSYSGVVSPTGDFWVARPGSGDTWGTNYASNESRGIYYHVYEGTISYSWSAEL